MHTFCLLTAAWLAVGADPPATAGPGCSCGAGQTPQAVYYQAAPPDSLRDRLRYFFNRPAQGSPYHSIPNNPPAVTGVNVAPTAAPPLAVVETAPPPPAAPAPADLQVAAHNQEKVGHEEDYSWITGQLYHVRADGGRWILRYGRLDEVDKYGGSVVLAPTVEMRNFREGDVVCVFGQVIDENRGTRPLGGAFYRVNSISMVERSDP